MNLSEEDRMTEKDEFEEEERQREKQKMLEDFLYPMEDCPD